MKNKKVILVCIISLVLIASNFDMYAQADNQKNNFYEVKSEENFIKTVAYKDNTSEKNGMDTDLKINDYIKEKFYFYTRNENEGIITFEEFYRK